MTTIRAIAVKFENAGTPSRGRIRRTRIEKGLAVQHFLIGTEKIVTQSQIQSQSWRNFEVILHPPGIILVTSACLDNRILHDVRGVQRAEQIAGIGVPGGGEKRAVGIECRRLRVAETPCRQAAVSPLLLVDLKRLNLDSERNGVLAMRPLDIVLKREGVGDVVECASAPIRASSVGRIGAVPGDLRERTGGLSRRQSGQSRFDWIIAVYRNIRDRHGEPRISKTELINQIRRRDISVFCLSSNRQFIHQPRAGIGER